MTRQTELSAPPLLKFLLAVVVSGALVGGCLTSWGFFLGSPSPDQEFFETAPVVHPSTTAYEGRAPGVAYEAGADTDADVAGDAP